MLLKPIEEENEVMIDASLLSCPVCYNVFSDAPLVLPCGHTFCSDCFKQINRKRGVDGSCPICRKPFIKGKIYPKNYMVESILHSMCLVNEKTEEVEEKSTKNSLAFAVARLQKQNEMLTKEKFELRKAMAEQEKLIRWLWCLLVGVTVLFTAALMSIT
ncbi:unnamed protein product [Bursaphelenchus xylophilus]|uniref:(pine wood nematode) hypothetical protein n=1 Tax=Bursaphelenchus xylophilus TaxID=6326 RepID=A0A7I8WVU8_BURXY|nr:unnamed protein product [Bursaphelenchus xylophilus]CAG9098057.1 unnamed protein product [Bursaphelenchus xylophilus]